MASRTADFELHLHPNSLLIAGLITGIGKLLAQPLLMGVKYATYQEFTTGIDQFHSHAPRVACAQNGRNTMQLFHGSVN